MPPKFDPSAVVEVYVRATGKDGFDHMPLNPPPLISDDIKAIVSGAMIVLPVLQDTGPRP